MNNGDKIRQMNNEELANLLYNTNIGCLYCIEKYKPNPFCDEDCEESIKAYLDSEVEKNV